MEANEEVEEYPSDYEDDLERQMDGPMFQDATVIAGKEDIDFKFDGNTNRENVIESELE